MSAGLIGWFGAAVAWVALCWMLTWESLIRPGPAAPLASERGGRRGLRSLLG